MLVYCLIHHVARTIYASRTSAHNQYSVYTQNRYVIHVTILYSILYHTYNTLHILHIIHYTYRSALIADLVIPSPTLSCHTGDKQVLFTTLS